MESSTGQWNEVLRLVKAQNEDPNEYKHREPLVAAIQLLFQEHLTFAVEKNAAQILWEVQKKLLDRLKVAMKDAVRRGEQNAAEISKTNYANALRVCYGEWAQLADLVQSGPTGEVEFLPLSETDVCTKLTRRPEDAPERQFAVVLFLRLGDVCRYKNDLHLCRTFYEAALGVDSRNGQCWNQLAVLTLAEQGSSAEATAAHRWTLLYMYTRAAYATVPFKEARSNADMLLQKRSRTSPTAGDDGGGFDGVFFQLLANIAQKQRCPESLFDDLNEAFFAEMDHVDTVKLLRTFVITAGTVKAYLGEDTREDLAHLVRSVYQFIVGHMVENWDDETLCVYQLFLAWMLDSGIIDPRHDPDVSGSIERLAEELEHAQRKPISRGIVENHFLHHFSLVPADVHLAADNKNLLSYLKSLLESRTDFH